MRSAWSCWWKRPFKQAIDRLNENMLILIDCHAVYSEYGDGKRAVCIYAEEVWDQMVLDHRKKLREAHRKKAEQKDAEHQKELAATEAALSPKAGADAEAIVKTDSIEAADNKV